MGISSTTFSKSNQPVNHGIGNRRTGLTYAFLRSIKKEDMDAIVKALLIDALGTGRDRMKAREIILKYCINAPTQVIESVDQSPIFDRLQTIMQEQKN
jgi:hypothetical protein